MNDANIPTPQQPVGQPVQNLQQQLQSLKSFVESPVLQAPPRATSSTPPTTNSAMSTPKKKFPVKIVGGVLALLIVVGGATAGYLLSQQDQDLRQDASTPGGVASLFVSPGTSTIASGVTTVTFKVNVGPTPIAIDGVQFIANITGTIPNDIQFEDATIAGLNPVTATLLDTSTGKKLTVAYLTTPPGPYQAGTSDIAVGTLTFTAPSSGSMTISFDPTLSKIIRNQTTDDVLKPPAPITYTFTSGGVGGNSGGGPTLTPTVQPTTPPGVTPTVTPLPTTTPVITGSITPSPTTQPGTGGLTGTPSPTPTVTPISTVTHSVTTTTTPLPTTGTGGTTVIPTSAPTGTIAPPVSGSVENTILLIVGGFFITVFGFLIWSSI